MRKELYCLQVNGNRKIWNFHIRMPEEYALAYQKDGLDVTKISHIIPEHINPTLQKMLLKFQDIFSIYSKHKNL